MPMENDKDLNVISNDDTNGLTSSEMDVDIDKSGVCDYSSDNRISEVKNEDKEELIGNQVPGNVPKTLIPSLRGLYTNDMNAHILKGLWAMSDEGHNNPDQTSPFEFKLHKPFDMESKFPVSGKYQGWFFLKQLPPLKGLKIEEKDMTLNFRKTDDNKYTIDGFGSNRFGSFTLYGTLVGYNIQLYREYLPKEMNLLKNKTNSTNKFKVKPLTLDQPSIAQDNSVPTPSSVNREASGRVRKVSNVMKEYEDTISTPKTTKSIIKTTSVTAATSSTTNNNNGRSQRLPIFITKCSDLLKEMQKHPQGVYFLEPVDDIKLGIPDYKIIIQKPMDFSTISNKLQSNQYETSEQFASDMRLVFRNAITYNQLRDHPVHIAARELNGKFEERYRALLNQLNNATMIKYNNLPEKQIVSKSNIPKKSVNKSLKINTQMKSLSNSHKITSVKSTNSNYGVRSFDAYMPPVMDQSSAQLIEMQRRMMEMQEELKALHTIVRQSEVKTSLELQREAAHNPLTLEEKRRLISKIHSLEDIEKLDSVYKLIDEAVPGSGSFNPNGDPEISLPIDSLDTLTLRKLQALVEGPVKSKSTPAIKRSQSLDSASNRPPNKKPRSNNKQKTNVFTDFAAPNEDNSLNNTIDDTNNHNNSHLLSMEEDELLFDPDSFEEDHMIHDDTSQGTNTNTQNLNEDTFIDNLLIQTEPITDVFVKDNNAWCLGDKNELISSENKVNNTDNNITHDANWELAAKEFQDKQLRERLRKQEEEKNRKGKLEDRNTNAFIQMSSSNLNLASAEIATDAKETERLRLMQLRKDEEIQRKLLEEQVAKALAENNDYDDLNEFVL